MRDTKQSWMTLTHEPNLPHTNNTKDDWTLGRFGYLRPCTQPIILLSILLLRYLVSLLICSEIKDELNECRDY
jgi:hypothetical protein